ncbi:MAG TPA: 50S ribosomal protein L29, partial [Acidimicrobiales bacterium]|nr:50S ribosomal protein L29 [Acidimicrobiales bacterium]
MTPSEYTGMEPSELEDKLLESRKELFNLRFQKATGQLDNTARLGRV